MNIIKTVALTKYYGKNKGIENLNLEIEEGEIFGFIGPNGAGKSTTIRTLLSLIKKTSGEAYIFGKDINKNTTEILKETGYLPSEVFYYNNMKAKDLFSYSASFYKKDCTEKIKYLADKLELDVEKKISDMSLGNKKKVGIIQGLLHSPKLIILDEPTSGLDPLMQNVFFELIKEENKRGATILFSSHILMEVQKICDRVAIIKDGEIIRVDEIAIIEKDFYKKVMFEISQKNLIKFKNLKGITNYKEKDNKVSFVYKGDINLIIKELSKIEVKDVEISNPSLEEIFIHYYGE